MKRTLAVLLALLFTACCIGGCNQKNNSIDVSKLCEIVEQYCTNHDYQISLPSDIKQDENEIMIVVHDVSMKIYFNAGTSGFAVFAEKESVDYSDDEISEIISIINLFSKRDFSIAEIKDVIENEKYSAEKRYPDYKLSDENLESLIHIRTFDFWENYGAEYCVYKAPSNLITLEIWGELKKSK